MVRTMLSRRKRGWCRWCWKTRRRSCGRCWQGGGGKKGKTKRWAAGVEAEDDQAEGDLHGGHQVDILLWKLFCWSIFFFRRYAVPPLGSRRWLLRAGETDLVSFLKWQPCQLGEHKWCTQLQLLLCGYFSSCLKRGPDFWLLQAILTPLCGSRPHQGKDYLVHLCHRHQDLWDNLLHHHPQQHCLTLSDLMSKKEQSNNKYIEGCIV